MSDFILKLKKNTRAAISKTTRDDVELIFESYIQDWRDEMEERASDGFNHFYIWKFNVGEFVYVLEDGYDIGKSSPEEEVNRSYTCGQFFNSKAFKEWILDLFPDCKLHYDSPDCENYSIRLSW